MRVIHRECAETNYANALLHIQLFKETHTTVSASIILSSSF